MTLVTRDATSGIWVPASAAEWTSFVSGLGIGSLLALYGCQDASSPAVDAINAINLAGLANTWQAAITGWARNAIQYLDGSSVQILNVSSASLPDLSTTSMTFVALMAMSGTPAAARSVTNFGPGGTAANNVSVEINTSNEYRLTDGTNTGVGTVNHGTSVIPVLVRYDKTHSTCAVFIGYTSPEKITKTFATPAGGSKGLWFGAAYDNAAPMSVTWAAVLSSTAAEMTDAQVDGLLNAFHAGPVVTAISVSPSSFTLGAPGTTQQLAATATRADGSTFDITATATWSTSNGAAATVSSSGLVTAVGGGSATITASFTSLGASMVSGTSACTVTGRTLTSITVSPVNPSIVLESTLQLTAIGHYTDSSTTDLTSTATWSTSDATIAGVSAGLVATLLSIGTATITATSGSISGSTIVTAQMVGPIVGTDVPDMVAVALSRLLEQDKNKPNIAALLTALVAPTQDVINACWQLSTQRTIYTSVGQQLDDIGALVGLPRLGLTDAEYQPQLLVQIIVNNSRGRTEELIQIASLTIGNPAATISVVSTHAIGGGVYLVPDGFVEVRIDGVALAEALAATLLSFLLRAVDGGVRLLLRWSDSPPSQTFRFDSGPGLDVGHLASALEG